MNESVLQSEIVELRRQLEEKESALQALRNEAAKSSSSPEKLSNADIARYSRQVILPEVGVKGQLALRNASVLIVGAGGLGKQTFNSISRQIKR